MKKSASTDNDLPAYIGRLAQIGRKLQFQSKSIAKAADNPFLRRDALEKTNAVLDELGYNQERVPGNVLRSTEEECVRRAVEFWHDFMRAAQAKGWEVYGTTGRRLIARGVFIAVADHSIIVEDVAGQFTPYVPHLIEELKPEIEPLIAAHAKGKEFSKLLTVAYDELGGHGEISLERVYRQAVMCSQRDSFWKALDPKKLNLLTRAIFRARLSYLLADEPNTADGRTIRLGTTVEQRDRWEIYSDAEKRVVQVGRLALVVGEGR